MDTMLCEEGKRTRIETGAQPINRPPHPRNRLHIGVVGQPDVEVEFDAAVDRNEA